MPTLPLPSSAVPFLLLFLLLSASPSLFGAPTHDGLRTAEPAPFALSQAPPEPGAEKRPAQGAPGGWNAPEALELVARARSARQDVEADSALRAYQARATGHLYFLLDRGDATGRTLVKADQLALDLFWQHPDRVRQEIVGRRSERRLPTTIRYHLDHLTVVTDDFGDLIVMGHGDEVRSALHPLAPGSEETYDFRLGDSLSVSLPDGASVRVHEIQVRARNPDRPGVVGSVFVDRRRGAVVRMGFTFTPASYVDPTLDHIRVRLDHSLWDGRFWLPYRQEIEIRRELPYLDTPGGTVIRARYEIGGYTFNNVMPASFFRGPEVRIRPAEELASYPFEEGLFAALDEEGLSPTPDLEEIRSTALQVMARDRLSGLRPVRLFAPSASAVVRHGRAEGVHVGAGVSLQPSGNLPMTLQAGYAFGRGEPTLQVEAEGSGAWPRFGVRGLWNQPRDLGPLPGASRVMSSLSSLLIDRDYVDPYFVTGGHVFHRFGQDGGAGLEVRGRYEEHEEPEFVLDAGSAGAFRPLPPVDGGILRAVDLDVELFPGGTGDGKGGWSIRAGVTGGRFESAGFGEARGAVGWTRRWNSREVEVAARLQGGAATARAPLQSLFYLGGRGTLPGYGYRTFAGDRYWLLRGSAAWGVGAPWIRPKIMGAVGAASRTATVASRLPGFSGAPLPTGSPLVSLGVGVGLFWDILQVEVGRGVNGGEWEWILSVNRTFWPWL